MPCPANIRVNVTASDSATVTFMNVPISVFGGAVTNVPPAAAAAGYNTQTFQSGFTAANIDSGLTYTSGYKWYKSNFYGFNPNTTLTAYGDGSASLALLDTNWLANQHWSTAGISGSNWVGMWFGGGAYFEAELTFNGPAVDTNNGFPAFWLECFEHVNASLGLVPNDQWPGQASGYAHFSEIDILEYLSPSGIANSANQWTGAIIDWYGTSTCTGGATPFYCNQHHTHWLPMQYIDYTNTTHKFGFLWKVATPSSPGSATWYIDGMIVGYDEWDQYTGQPPVPPPNIGTPRNWTYGIIDQQHFAIILGTGHEASMRVNNVRVFQASSNNNLIR